MDILGKQVVEQLVGELPQCAIAEVNLVADNEVFTLFGGATEDGRLLIVKVAHEYIPDKIHRRQFNAREILDQEALLCTHCRAHGLPAPVIHGKSYREGSGLDFVVLDWLEDDHVTPDPFFMGSTLNRLHSMNPPAFEPVAQRGGPLEKMICTAILDRTVAITRFNQRRFRMPAVENLLAHLSWPDRRTSLLHMDFTARSLSSVGGVITGVSNWTNALIGPPTLELMGMDEHGLLDDSFLGGYANYEMFRAPPATETAFRLYAATEIAIKSVLNTPDPANEIKALNRVDFLFEEFARLSN